MTVNITELKAHHCSESNSRITHLVRVLYCTPHKVTFHNFTASNCISAVCNCLSSTYTWNRAETWASRISSNWQWSQWLLLLLFLAGRGRADHGGFTQHLLGPEEANQTANARWQRALSLCLHECVEVGELRVQQVGGSVWKLLLHLAQRCPFLH